MDFQFAKQKQLIGIALVLILKVNAVIPVLENAIVYAAAGSIVPAQRTRLRVTYAGKIGNLRICGRQETQCDILEFEIASFKVKPELSDFIWLVQHRDEELHVPYLALVVLDVFFR